MKRPQRWQLEKQRTAKAIRDYPRCEEKGCAGRGMGWIGGHFGGGLTLRWVCPHHAAEAQRAQRERT